MIYQANDFYYVIDDDYKLVEKTALYSNDVDNDTAVYTADTTALYSNDIDNDTTASTRWYSQWYSRWYQLWHTWWCTCCCSLYIMSVVINTDVLDGWVDVSLYLGYQNFSSL